MRIVFLGSADFGLPCLQRLRADGHTIAGIVTTPPAPKGRGRKLTPSEVAVHARASGLGPILEPASLKSPDVAAALSELGADLFVVIAFRILPESIFSIPPMGTVNVHASLLPRFRGPAPIQRAIEAGETRTGVTIFRIDRGVDTGGILAQTGLDVGVEETTPQLRQRLSELGARTLSGVVHDLEAGTSTPQPQDNTTACAAPKLRKEESRIDWALPAPTIFNKMRAYKPFPGTSTTIEGAHVGIDWARPLDSEPSSQPPGTILRLTPEGFVAQCGVGALHVLQVKPENGKLMSADAYARGHRIHPGQRFA